MRDGSQRAVVQASHIDSTSWLMSRTQHVPAPEMLCTTTRSIQVLDRCFVISESQRAAVQDTRMRSVLNGVIDGIGDRDVELAFRVLYEDFGPIRFAGDIMFKYLDGTVSLTVGNCFMHFALSACLMIHRLFDLYRAATGLWFFTAV